jgi:hypothetical protein
MSDRSLSGWSYSLSCSSARVAPNLVSLDIAVVRIGWLGFLDRGNLSKVLASWFIEFMEDVSVLTNIPSIPISQSALNSLA